MVNRWKLSLAFGVVVLAGLAAILALVATDAFGGESGRQNYMVGVYFGTTVTQDDIDEVDALLRSLDPDADFILLQSFPPVGSAVLASDGEGLCAEIGEALAAKDYVKELSCKPWSGGTDGDPDQPDGISG